MDSTPAPARSIDSQGPWSRALWMDREIRAGRYPSIRGLREEFGCSRRTAYNSVDFLRDSLGAPLKYCPRRHGYFYEEPVYALPAVFLQQGELLALLLAEQVTRLYLGTSLEAPLREAVRKLSAYLPEESAVELSDLAERFHFAGSSSVVVPMELLTDVQQAIRERRRLRILYYTASRDDTRERTVDPHFLDNVRGDWLLVAWDEWRGADRVFMLTRIREYRVLDERFERRPELRPGVYTRHHFQTEHGKEPRAVVLRFDAYQARWIRERTWHPKSAGRGTAGRGPGPAAGGGRRRRPGALGAGVWGPRGGAGAGVAAGAGAGGDAADDGAVQGTADCPHRLPAGGRPWRSAWTPTCGR